MLAAGSTRTRQLAVSAMKRSPAASTATPVGWSSSLAVAASPSPLKPAAPVPATVTAVRDPARTSCTRCAVASAMKTSPCPSTATSLGCPMLPRPAQVPPANVTARPGPDVQPVERLRPGRHDEDPAVAGVGHEEVPGRIERDPAGPVEDAGPDDGADDRRPSPPAAGAAPAPATAATRRRARPAATVTGSRRTAHIMPVAAATGLGDGP